MKVTIHKKKFSDSETMRAKRFAEISPEQKMKELCYLIELSILLSGDKPLKKPKGLGLLIER